MIRLAVGVAAAAAVVVYGGLTLYILNFAFDYIAPRNK